MLAAVNQVLYGCTYVQFKWVSFMLITIDTSAIIAVIGNEMHKARLVSLTQGAQLVVPLSVHLEIGNAFSAMLKRKAIPLSYAQQALEAYKMIPTRLIEVQLERTLVISEKFNIYAYDAYLLQCAEQTNSHLMTLDRNLLSVAQRMGLSTVEV
jgi:predicted nucleic acid-binding protein